VTTIADAAQSAIGVAIATLSPLLRQYPNGKNRWPMR
jgi:hypothetical protein